MWGVTFNPFTPLFSGCVSRLMSPIGRKQSFAVCILEVKTYFQITHCKTLKLYFEKATEMEP